jgi:hypothetical protein
MLEICAEKDEDLHVKCQQLLVTITQNKDVFNDITELSKISEFPFCDSRVASFVQTEGWDEIKGQKAGLLKHLITIK